MSAAMAGMAMPMPMAWSPGHAAMMALMWALMMLAMMLLLFVGGVANLAWIAGLALLVLAEELLPGGPMAGQMLSAALILWGAAGLVLAGAT